MKTRSLSLIAVAVLAACGGGSDSPPPPVAAAPPVAPAPTPKPNPNTDDVNDFPIIAPPPAKPPVTVPQAPAPITPPVVQQPPAPPAAQPPAGSPPAPQPPAPPPPLAEGTYITGKVLRAALQQFSSATDHLAYPTEQLTNSRYPTVVSVQYYSDVRSFNHYTFPYEFSNPYWEPRNFPSSFLYWDAGYTDSVYSLKEDLFAFTTEGPNQSEVALHRKDGTFPIKPTDQYKFNATFAEWRGVDDQQWFVQLQVADYHDPSDGSVSNAAFNFCVHQYLPKVRRLACTIHDRDTGEYRGSRLLDDSNGLGAVTYLPKR